MAGSISIDIPAFFVANGSLPSRIEFETILPGVIKALCDDGWIQVQESIIHKHNDDNEENDTLRSGRLTRFCDEDQWCTLVKDKLLIKLHNRGNKDQNYDLEFYFPCDNAKEAKKFKKYIYDILSEFYPTKTNKSKFYLLIKDHYGDLVLRDFEAKLPSEDLDLSLNYGKEFPKTDKKIKDKLSNTESGLYVFHGSPGTGKSTYIKHLAQQLNKKFIYVPEFMVTKINDPSVLQLFMKNDNSILVLEDAEKLIESRESNNDNFVSMLLNITDGILADIMKMSVIITYNTTSDKVDQALLRKGRLQYMHEFGNLGYTDIIRILESKGLTNKEIEKLFKEGAINNEASLADIYNIFDSNNAIVQDDKPSIGFGV